MKNPKEIHTILSNGLTLCFPINHGSNEFYIYFKDTTTGEEFDDGRAYYDVAEWSDANDLNSIQSCLGAIFGLICSEHPSLSDINENISIKFDKGQSILVPSFGANSDGVNRVSLISKNGETLSILELNDFVDSPVGSMLKIVEFINTGFVMMSNDEYVEDCGDKCPRCRSSEIRGDEFEIGIGNALRNVSCDDCDLNWSETFTSENESDICACGCAELDYGETNGEGTSCYQDVSCPECEATWDNDYEMTGFENV